MNGERVVHIPAPELPEGRPGFVAFRETKASFRNFTMAKAIPSGRPTTKQRQYVADLLDGPEGAPECRQDLIQKLKLSGVGVGQILEDRAAALEIQAVQMRQLAEDVHAVRVTEQLLVALNLAESDNRHPDLLRAALLLAQLDNKEVRPDEYIRRVDAIAEEILSELSENATETEKLKSLDRWLFQLNGFRGSQNQYYTSSNSYLNEVIDDREGLPVALSVLYIEIAKRLGLHIQGVGLPGHFIVRFDPPDKQTATEYIDVFHQGERMTEEALDRHVRERGLRMEPRFTAPQEPVAIIERMLRNLLGLAERDRNDEHVLRYLEVLVSISGDDPEFRAKRLEMRARAGHPAAALEDAEWFIDHQPSGIDLGQLRQLKAKLESELESAD